MLYILPKPTRAEFRLQILKDRWDYNINGVKSTIKQGFKPGKELKGNV